MSPPVLGLCFTLGEQIRCTGVSSLAPVDFEYAKEKLRSTIKLLGTAVLSADGATLSVFVSPVLVSRDRPVAATAAAAAGHRGSPVPVEAEVWCGGKAFVTVFPFFKGGVHVRR